jgi:uncharacterized protein HemY
MHNVKSLNSVHLGGNAMTRGVAARNRARIYDRNRHLGRASFRAPGVQIGFRVFKLRSIISRIMLHQQRPRFDDLVVRHPNKEQFRRYVR